jgi:hypothetical protein
VTTIYVAGSHRKQVTSSDVEFASGKHFQVILTNVPRVIDNLIRTSIDIIPPDTLVVLHSRRVRWVAYSSESATYGAKTYFCSHCHHPLEIYHTEREINGEIEIRHHRYLCRCTMLFLSPEMMPW